MTKSRVERGAHKHRWSDIGSGPQREHFEARRIDVRPSGADFTVLGVKVCAPSRSALVDVGTSSAVFAFAWIAITSEKAMTRTRLGSRDHPLENHTAFITLADLLTGASSGISAARAPDTRAIVPRKALSYRPWT